MKNTRKFLCLLLSLTMVCSLALVSASAETAAELPRNETLYFAGQQWGSVNGWNPLSDDMINWFSAAGVSLDGLDITDVEALVKLWKANYDPTIKPAGMEHGRFVEHGTADEVILTPKAEYTKRLISDVPKIYEPWDLSTVKF